MIKLIEVEYNRKEYYYQLPTTHYPLPTI